MGTKNGMIIDTIERQRRYVESHREKAKGLGVVFADAFLRGMRDLGYKNPAWALAEPVDNSYQAGADVVSIRFGFESKSQSKPDYIAICDNGNGMIKDMIGFAVRWGGTDREGDRSGFGRYGYGLPSSAVSIAKRYTVYARAAGAEWYAVTVDIDDLAAAAGDIEKTEALLAPRKASPPTWVLLGARGDDQLDVGALKSGVVIVLEDLDRLNRLNGWMKTDTLQTKLLQHFGVIYRHFIPDRLRIYVHGEAAQAVDPLFLMEHGRFYDATSARAERIETRTFEVETPWGAKGNLRVRASVLPPNFQLEDPTDYRPDMRGVKHHKGRLEVMKKYNGLMICRAGRQIDCISPAWTKFQNYDINTKIEVDFDPSLDEYFSMTTSKQQIVLDDEMWEKLRHDGKNGGALEKLVKDMRNRRDAMHEELAAKAENKAGVETPRPSVVALEETEKFKGSPRDPTPAQKEQAQRNLEQAAKERAEETGKSEQETLAELTEETSDPNRKWELEFATVPEGPFYRPLRLGEQKRLVINTEHPFYSKIFMAAEEARGALEVMLLVLADRELDATGETEMFYKAERQRWSERLRHALNTLVTEESLQNKASAVAEFMHMASGN